ncbi:MAG: AAA family ATPase [Bdellovibrionales bacterium]|nr:AAA family ATPase [Bdellovibrionales bacterium]
MRYKVLFFLLVSLFTVQNSFAGLLAQLRLRGDWFSPVLNRSVTYAIDAQIFSKESQKFNDTVIFKIYDGNRWTTVNQWSNIALTRFKYNHAMLLPDGGIPGVQLVKVDSANAAAGFDFIGASAADGKALSYNSLDQALHASTRLPAASDSFVSTSPEEFNLTPPDDASIFTYDHPYVVAEANQRFSIKPDGPGVIEIKSQAGKRILFRGPLTFNREDVRIENGILSLKGSRRKVDLWMFDAEVARIGNTLESLDSGKESAEFLKSLDMKYPDLVALEREKIRNGTSVRYEELDSPTINSMVRILKLGKNVKLLGLAGSGKTTETKNFARLIAEGKIKSFPRTTEVRILSMAMLGATPNVGILEVEIVNILTYSKAVKPIWIGDEFHALRGMGAHSRSATDAGQYFKPALEDGEMRTIAISTKQEWNNAFASDKPLNERFEAVIHEEPSGEELVTKIKNDFRRRGLTLPKDDAIKLAVELSDRFAISGANPRKSINLLLKAHIVADDLYGEGSSATTEAVEKAALETYDISPVYFSKEAISKKLLELRGKIDEALVGGDAAKIAMLKLWFRKLADVGSDEKAPSLIFYGPSGTGKTTISKISGEEMEYKVKEIGMAKYAEGGVAAFRHEVYLGLSESPNTVFVLDETEKAHPDVQNAILEMQQPGEFTVNFVNNAGDVIFEEVRCTNALFIVNTNAGQRLLKPKTTPVGFNNAAKEIGIPDRSAAEAELTRPGGLVAPLVSRASAIIGMTLPTEHQFRAALEINVAKALARESKKHGIKITLKNQELLMKEMMEHFKYLGTDYRSVGQLIEDRLEMVIANVVIDPRSRSSKSVEIRWDATMAKDYQLPAEIDCERIYFGN